MGKKRKTNPRRIPISKSDIDRNAIIDEATRDNVYYGWLLVVKAMCEQDGMTNDAIMDAWNMVNQMTSGANGKHLDTESVSARAKEIMGFGLPYSVSFSHIHSQVELDIVRRKLHVNAIYSAFFIICVAIEKLGKSLAKKIIDDVEVDAYWYSGEEMQENGEALECEEYWVKVTNPHSTYFDDTYDWPFLDTAFEADLDDIPLQMEFTVQYVLSLGIGHIVPVNKTFKYGEKDSVWSLVDCIHAFEAALKTPEGIKKFFADCPNAILDGKLLTLIGGAPRQPIERFEFDILGESNPEELGNISEIRNALYSVRCINYRWLDKE